MCTFSPFGSSSGSSSLQATGDTRETNYKALVLCTARSRCSARSQTGVASLQRRHTHHQLLSEDAASHKELAELFGEALAKWAPAMHVSSLVFDPDTVCTGDLASRCLCTTPRVAETTLHIMLAGKGGAEATVGYLPPEVAIPEDGKPRHYIAWADDPDLFGKAAALMMAHEIGESARLIAPD